MGRVYSRLEKTGGTLWRLSEVSRTLAEAVAYLSLLHRARGAGGTQQSSAMPTVAGELGE